jgi:hypothetical protein
MKPLRHEGKHSTSVDVSGGGGGGGSGDCWASDEVETTAAIIRNARMRTLKQERNGGQLQFVRKFGGAALGH